MLSNKQIQTNLWFLNFYTGKIDGNIKNLKTKNSIKNFQKSFSLTQDGIWGNNSNTKCVQIIKDIQKKLGCKMIDGIVLYKTGETYEKCKQYQLLNNLVIDGICGVNTRSVMNQDNARSWSMYPHFKQSEFACKCGCGYSNINLKVVEILEDIRSHFGNKPLKVTSGCRCEKYNRKLKGSIQGSKHLSGEASDIWISGVSKQNLLNYTMKLMHEGKIKYTYTNNSNMKYAVHINI